MVLNCNMLLKIGVYNVLVQCTNPVKVNEEAHEWERNGLRRRFDHEEGANPAFAFQYILVAPKILTYVDVFLKTMSVKALLIKALL